jgi:hypothetical protein
MFRSIVRKTLALAIPAIGLFTLSAPAEANIRTSTLGTACQFSSAAMRGGTQPAMPGPGTVGAGYSDNGPWAFGDNDETYTLGFPIGCPLVRQLPLSTDGLSDLEVRFQVNVVYPPSPPVVRTVQCTAYTMRSDGSILDSSQKQMVVANSGTGTTVMDFGSDINKSSSKGTYGVFCFMPIGVVLHSIYHSEVDGIDGN